MFKKNSVIAIYSVPAVWILWALLFRFNGILSYITCAFISIVTGIVLMRFFPPLEEQLGDIIDDNITEAEIDEDWAGLVTVSKQHAALVRDTPLFSSMQELYQNIIEINEAIERDNTRGDNKYIKRFQNVFLEYSKDLKDYIACYKNPNPGPSMQKVLRLTEERFAKLAEVSKLLLDELYRAKGTDLEINAKDLDIEFRSLEHTDVFNLHG